MGLFTGSNNHFKNYEFDCCFEKLVKVVLTDQKNPWKFKFVVLESVVDSVSMIPIDWKLHLHMAALNHSKTIWTCPKLFLTYRRLKHKNSIWNAYLNSWRFLVPSLLTKFRYVSLYIYFFIFQMVLLLLLECSWYHSWTNLTPIVQQYPGLDHLWFYFICWHVPFVVFW